MQLTNNLIYPWKFIAAPKKCVRFTDEKISKGQRCGMVKKVSRISKKFTAAAIGKSTNPRLFNLNDIIISICFTCN